MSAVLAVRNLIDNGVRSPIEVFHLSRERPCAIFALSVKVIILRRNVHRPLVPLQRIIIPGQSLARPRRVRSVEGSMIVRRERHGTHFAACRHQRFGLIDIAAVDVIKFVIRPGLLLRRRCIRGYHRLLIGRAVLVADYRFLSFLFTATVPSVTTVPAGTISTEISVCVNLDIRHSWRTLPDWAGVSVSVVLL